MPVGAKIELSPGLTIEIEVGDGASPIDQQKNVIEACAFWQQLPTACPMPGCGAPLVFFARHPQEFHYYGLKCTGPKIHEMNLSERKDKTSFYVKDDAWKDAYHQNDEGASAPAAAQAKQAQTSPSGGQAGPKASPPLIASVMRSAGEKGYDSKEKVVSFIQDCKSTFDWATGITEVSQLTESQAKDIIETLRYM